MVYPPCILKTSTKGDKYMHSLLHSVAGISRHRPGLKLPPIARIKYPMLYLFVTTTTMRGFLRGFSRLASGGGQHHDYDFIYVIF